VQYPLTEIEHVWLRWYRRLRVARYIGTAADLYTRLTGRQHPRTAGGAS